MYEEQVRKKEKKKDAANLSGTETILIVEDEDEVRTIASEILKENNYKVLEALDGEQALAVFQKNSRDIHLILTDVVMPKMGVNS